MEASIYRLKYRDILTLCVLALLSLGVIMVQSASMRVSQLPANIDATKIENVHTDWKWTAAGIAQLKMSLLAFAVYLIVGRLDYTRLAARDFFRNPTVLFIALSALLCMAVLVPGLGKVINGARRWLRFIPIQPSELGKWSVVFFLCFCISFRAFDMSKFKGFAVMLIPVGIITLLVVIQDFGTAALIACCIFLVCMVGQVRMKHLLALTAPALVIGFWFVRHKEYRWRRITAFIDPYSAPQKEGYHMIQSLLSFSTGGIWGRGLGNGIQKLGYLPEDTTDFIFAVICEELGLFGALLTISFYIGIIFVAWQVIRRQRDSFGRLLAFGIATMVGMQALINIAVATVSVPTKGLSLPLVSAGGTGLVITCGALGVLYSVSRLQNVKQSDEPVRFGLWNSSENIELSSRDFAGAL